MQTYSDPGTDDPNDDQPNYHLLDQRKMTELTHSAINNRDPLPEGFVLRLNELFLGVTGNWVPGHEDSEPWITPDVLFEGGSQTFIDGSIAHLERG